MKKVVAYKVSKLNEHIQKNVNGKYAGLKIWISGEVSNYKKQNGYTSFFTLKDESASIDARIFTNQLSQLTFELENGMEILVQGEVTFYEKNGKISFAVDLIEEHGLGDLHKKFEIMKEKLRLEGLFDAEHKKMIPKFPKVIGVVTSETGAVIGDIKRTLNRRYPLAEIVLYPTIVQGKAAVKSVIRGIEALNQKGNVDVMIVGRGGGSMEELWAFNEEVVARAIFASKVPIVSAVGHDSDVTISNFVADISASTPTAAAELVTPYTIEELTNTVVNNQREIKKFGEKAIKTRAEKMETQMKTIKLLHPRVKVQKLKLDIELSKEKMTDEIEKKIERQKHRYEKLVDGLHPSKQKEKIKTKQSDAQKRETELKNKIKIISKEKQKKFTEKAILLDGLSPMKTLARGYSLVYKEDKILKESSRLKVGDRLTIKMNKGKIKTIIEEIGKEEKEND